LKTTTGIAVVLTTTLALSGCQDGSETETQPAASPPPTETALASDEDKTLYALGLMLGQNLKQMQLDDAELEKVKLGLVDGALGTESKVTLQEWGPRIQEYVNSRARAAAGAEKASSQEFLEQAAAQQGAVKTDTGLIVRTVKPGSGASPGPTSRVKVHYVGTLIDGTQFDSSREDGKPVEFPLNQVIPCWGEGLQKMKVGETAQLVCPSDIAYGNQGRPPVIKPGATLVFEVELLDIVG
jgi:FKBP-type peptidyl-prolyl cis-trans isomerase